MTGFATPPPAGTVPGQAVVVPYRRHPLGLPAGSVRALMTFMVLGIFWTLLVVSEDKDVYVPSYLYYLMFLMLGHYFAARGHTTVGAGEAHPLHLPPGTLRIVIVLGFVGVVAWAFYRNPEFLKHLKVADRPDLPLIVLGAFFLGIMISRVANRVLAGPQGMPVWYQDMQAWVSLLAILGLAAEIVIRLVISPALEQQNKVQFPEWEGLLAAVVAFYFGARS